MAIPILRDFGVRVRRCAVASAFGIAFILGLASPVAAQMTSVGNFVKVTGTAPVSQVIPHKLFGTPVALLVWTEGRTDETFSDSTAVVFRTAAKAGAASGVLTLTIAKPTGTVLNDVLIAAIGVDANTPAITAPAGWTLVRRVDNTNATANTLAIYRKTAGSAEPANYSWTLSASTGSAGGIMAFSGVDLQNPIDVESGVTTGNGTAHVTPTVTTTATDETIVTVHTMASAATWAPPAGMTEAVDQASGALGATGQSIEMNYAAQAGIAATGTKSASANANGDRGNT